jgi:hypothetical protein
LHRNTSPHHGRKSVGNLSLRKKQKSHGNTFHVAAADFLRKASPSSVLAELAKRHRLSRSPDLRFFGTHTAFSDFSND